MQELKNERHTLEEVASKLISEALRAGAEAAEVCGSYGHHTKLVLEKQDFHLASSDDGYQFGVRVVRGSKQGFASCNTVEKSELKEVALRAVEIAGFSPENPYSVIVSSPMQTPPKSLPLWDSSLFRLSLQSQKEWTQTLFKEALKDPRIKLNEGSVNVNYGLSLVSNSRGTHHVEKETACSWSLMGMAAEKDTLTSFDYFSQMTRNARNVPALIAKSAQDFRESLIKNLRQGPGNSYKGIVIFSPRAVLDILIGSLAYHLNGRVLAEGSSKWKLADLGKTILNSALTLSDEPAHADRSGATVFDREGTPAKNFTLIKNGTLNAFLLDHYAGKALGQTSTGNAVGGPSSIPTVGSHSLSVGGGPEPLGTLIQRVSKTQPHFLYVHRYSGNTDPVTGDFSGVAKGGEWWHGGEFAHCAKETLISGNLFEALGQNLVGISSETQVVDSSEESPTFAIEGVSVTCR